LQNRSGTSPGGTAGATIGWSHDLLTPDERTLFRRLALFADVWTLEAARAVYTLEDLDPAVILDMLDRLVDQSLVQMRETGDRTRYRFLETVRQFAQTQLEASGEAAEIGRRQAVHFVAVAEAERRRLELVMALATEPSLLLLDEPTAGLSAIGSHAFVAMIKHLPPELTVVIIEHDLDVVFTLATRVGLSPGNLHRHDDPHLPLHVPRGDYQIRVEPASTAPVPGDGARDGAGPQDSPVSPDARPGESRSRCRVPC
jgi:hypothetical protein